MQGWGRNGFFSALAVLHTLYYRPQIETAFSLYPPNVARWKTAVLRIEGNIFVVCVGIGIFLLPCFCFLTFSTKQLHPEWPTAMWSKASLLTLKVFRGWRKEPKNDIPLKNIAVHNVWGHETRACKLFSHCPSYYSCNSFNAVYLISFNIGLVFSGNSNSNEIKVEGMKVTYMRGWKELRVFFFFFLPL